MEVKQQTVFIFSTSAAGQGFSFSIPSESRREAAKDLLEKLQIITRELQQELNSSKATS